ncbi:MAG TPA: hypothetical protein VF012_08830 [Nocardioidaceae bacterium]
MTTATSPGDDNRQRFVLGTDHVESWFVRANHPTMPRALWLKATVLTRTDGTTLSQAWFSVFDGDRTEAFCSDVPLGESTFESNGSSLAAQVGPLRLQLAEDHGASAGELTSGAGRVRWDLRFDRLPGVLGRPMCLLPTRRLLDAPFPRNKLVTPLPVATFTGHVTWNDETWDIARWIGMQGHNWGAAHSPEYAWGQCVFADGAGRGPTAVMEGASGRIELGRRVSPLMSMLVVRRGEDEYRFDRVIDLWRQRPVLDFPRWALRMKGADGEAELEMRGRASSMVCLTYQNPARPPSYCLNSKTANVSLAVTPRRGGAFTIQSEYGGALEFLRPRPEPAVQPVV